MKTISLNSMQYPVERPRLPRERGYSASHWRKIEADKLRGKEQRLARRLCELAERHLMRAFGLGGDVTVSRAPLPGERGPELVVPRGALRAGQRVVDFKGTVT